MNHKHTILALIVGWLISFVFPPQALLGMVKGKSA